jgi:D-alanyl-lipoteichoic acid acyltransferase DltB (MBOAT superfamily)
MVFNSIQFAFFFVAVTTIYFLIPHRYRWMLLLGASCYFYMAFVPIYILILGITIVIDYFAGICIEGSRGRQKYAYLLVSILSTCAVLFTFKYYNFFTNNVNAFASLIGWNYSIGALQLLLPIGLSFHTFQSLSYVIEVYRGNQKAERHFGIYSLYVMFYPQLVAGPIERPQNLLHQFREVHRFDYQRVRGGLLLMLWGLFKKLVVADRLSLYVDAVYGHVGQHNGTTLAVATVFFAFEIYCDFSGYSDIAIGAAKVMGFDLMQNFNRPYFSRSISEFWRRWHISLSTWFRDYVYLPLGGNRVARERWYFNLLVTFGISGLWHGANWTYVTWGLLNGFYLVFGAASEPLRARGAQIIGLGRAPRLHEAMKTGITFALICVGWIFFRAASFGDAMRVLEKIVLQRGPLFTGGARDLIYGAMGIVLLLGFDWWTRGKTFDAAVTERSLAVRWFVYLFLLIGILSVGVFDGSQFIYFQF